MGRVDWAGISSQAMMMAFFGFVDRYALSVIAQGVSLPAWTHRGPQGMMSFALPQCCYTIPCHGQDCCICDNWSGGLTFQWLALEWQDTYILAVSQLGQDIGMHLCAVIDGADACRVLEKRYAQHYDLRPAPHQNHLVDEDIVIADGDGQCTILNLKEHMDPNLDRSEFTDAPNLKFVPIMEQAK